MGGVTLDGSPEGHRSPSSSPPHGRTPASRRPVPRRLLAQRLRKPKLMSRLSMPGIASSGRGQLLSHTDPEEAKAQLLGTLAIRVYAARNLEAKDKNGKSDPFFQLRAGDRRVTSEVVKACLNPVWGVLPDHVHFHAKDGFSRKPVIVDFPVYANLVERQHVEVIFWDKDRLTKNDYLGEVSLGFEEWFSKTLHAGAMPQDVPISFADPRNQPKWYPLVSSRHRSHVQGEVLLAVGFVPPVASGMTSVAVDERLSGDRELELAEFFVNLCFLNTSTTRAERILTAPPTEGVGMLSYDDGAGVRLSRGVGMGEYEDSDASDDESQDSDTDTSGDDFGSDLDEDETDGLATPFDEVHYNLTVSPPHGENEDPLAVAGARLANVDLAGDDAPAREARTDTPDHLLALRNTGTHSAVTTPGGSRKILGLPNFIKRTSSSMSISSIRSASSMSKAPGRLSLRERMRTKSASSTDMLNATSNPSDAPSPARRPKRRRRMRKTKRLSQVGSTMVADPKHGTYQLQGGDDIIGICFVEIVSAHDLPRWKNMTRTTFDMDPFVITSFSQKIFRTRVVRHSLDPVWQERLFFHVKRHELPFGISFSCFDWDKVSSNDFIGEVTLDMAKLVERAPKADSETGLFAHRNGQIAGDQLHEYRLALVPSRTEELDAKKPCEITIRAKFTPYAAMRQLFWRRYLQQYDSEDCGELTDIELFSMLDSLGSTLSHETRESFYTRYGKQSSDRLTADELVACLESEIHKPYDQKRFVDDAKLVDEPDAMSMAPPAADTMVKPMTRAELSDNASLAGPAGFTGSNALDGGRYGRDPVITRTASEMGSMRSIQRGGTAMSTDTVDDQRVERVINIRTCPLCHRPRLSKRSEMDIVTHLALCASQDWATVGSLLTGNFVTVNQAHRKWLTKIISKVSNGSYELGANSANIIVQNRVTGQLQEEKMQVYVRLGIRLLYKGLGSNRMEGARIRRLLESMSVKQGIKFDSPESAKDIKPFVAFHALDVNEILEPISSFKNFNQFFYRKLKPDARPPAEPNNPDVLVSSADCRMMAFATVADAKRLWIKGREFSVPRLLGDQYKDDVKNYEEGALCIFRLAPQDYHRFHKSDGYSIIVRDSLNLRYLFHAAARIDVYGDNVREIVPIDSPQFGRVYNACIGAMMVGSIKLTVRPGDTVKRAQEYGYFAFGGSTIVTIFPPDTVQFDRDLLDNSARSIESLVRVGMRIGVKL